MVCALVILLLSLCALFMGGILSRLHPHADRSGAGSGSDPLTTNQRAGNTVASRELAGELPVEEALKRLAAQLGAAYRIRGLPRTRVGASLIEGSPEKNVVKLADALGVPLVAFLSNGLPTRVASLTLMEGALIAGDTSENQERLLGLAVSADPEMRENAIETLDAIGSDERFDAVYAAKLKGDSSEDVRAAAAFALRATRRDEGFDALVWALADPSDWVVDNARAAIEQLGPKSMKDRLLLALRIKGKAHEEAADLLEHVFGVSVPQDETEAGTQ